MSGNGVSALGAEGHQFPARLRHAGGESGHPDFFLVYESPFVNLSGSVAQLDRAAAF